MKLTIKNFFLLALAFSFSAQLLAQGNQGNNSQSATGLNLNFDIFDGTYYSDPLGIQLSARMLPYEQIIDKESYVLGINDLLAIKVNASQTIFLRGIIVNPVGDITLPTIGPVNVSGLTITEAEEKIKENASEILRDISVNITIENPRPIFIQVKGAVPHPGRYMIPSQSRVDQATYSSINDGNRDLRTSSLSNSSNVLQSDSYSFRNIQIQRSNGTILKADLVDYFRTGNKSSNPIVKDGDIITLKNLTKESPMVSISGAVNADYEFEFVYGDTPFKLLQIGGGFEETADTTRLLVFRRTNEGTQTITVDSNSWDDFMLQPNDRVVAPFGNTKNEAASVWVYGEVEVPGNFPIVSGETNANEVLEWAGGLTNDALSQAAYLIRTGGFRNEIPNKFNSDLMRRTSDQLIQGLEYLEAETKLSQKKVFLDLENQEQLANIKVFDGDRFYIPRNENTIFILGQVNNPGYFPYEDQKSISEYITQAGGFALSADRERVFIIKAGNSTWYRPGEADLESGDRIFVDRNPIEELNALRSYEVQQSQLKNSRTQLIMTGITTITGIITTYVAVRNIR